ncbi:sulfite exporter TauE/SafE family protein [Terrimonas sp. NA20]|uniref:Probable membrane transporter protein n=1 Tax=Terrimonas ginsenosidimutans TaxID=2908004 RepID=A0ABS9KQS0_9BACT|nr:sulfite exporter TauE/SafE family protein [Terrimonas ginsenosidimutans]MCG2614664.1 sulfite exporter TauE/SafE family protein [Terrimonas ginsenosidimutans]
MEILGYLAAVLIGVSLGMVGSGGSILTVPVLVYLMSVNPMLATTSSLFIVGSTSLIGGLRAYGKKQVNFKAVTEFGIPSIFSIFIARHYILPELPDRLFSIGNIQVYKPMFLMVVFAILMLAASLSMIFSNKRDALAASLQDNKYQALPLVLLGLGVGMITGLLGAGGGFLIIPSLVIFLRLPMKTAVGTSLLIIAINSLFGFLFSLKQFQYDWSLLLSFSVLAIAGLFLGSKFAEKIPGNSLKKGFGWFVLVMGVYIILKEVFRF